MVFNVLFETKDELIEILIFNIFSTVIIKNESIIPILITEKVIDKIIECLKNNPYSPTLSVTSQQLREICSNLLWSSSINKTVQENLLEDEIIEILVKGISDESVTYRTYCLGTLAQIASYFQVRSVLTKPENYQLLYNNIKEHSNPDLQFTAFQCIGNLITSI